MSKLELKHLAPYLPYGLVFNLTRSHNPFICIGLTVHEDVIMAHRKGGSSNVSLEKYYKPVLRPISELTRPILEEAGFICHIDYLTNEFNHWVETDGRDRVINDLPYGHSQFLFANHFDVFGLIDQGLAIDINTLDNAH